jgi:hypothetical protein
MERSSHGYQGAEKISYDPALQLFHWRSTSTVGESFEQTRDLYWSAGKDLTATSVIDCIDYPSTPAVCEFEWLKAKMVVRTKFDRSHLYEWSSIRRTVDDFINKYEIKSVPLRTEEWVSLDDPMPVVSLEVGNAAVTAVVNAEAAVGNIISTETQEKIRKDLAAGYLAGLAKQYRASKEVTRDIDYKESWDFHDSIFRRYGLSLPHQL